MRFSLCCFFSEYISVPSKNGFRFFPFSRIFSFCIFFSCFALVWAWRSWVPRSSSSDVFGGCEQRNSSQLGDLSTLDTRPTHNLYARSRHHPGFYPSTMIAVNKCGSSYPSWFLFLLASTPARFPSARLMVVHLYHALWTLVSLITSASALVASALD